MQGNKRNEEKRARIVHLVILAVLQSAMAVELVFLISEQQWVHVFLVTGIMLTMALPVVLKARFSVQIPSEIQILAILFGFATLFLGEVRDYYERFWWWDLVLHATAGLLLGLQGFMTVYILNEDRHVDLHMRPSFLAIFAFCFSQAIGAIWEIFEFTMDQVFGLTMQKPMLGDPSGLTDTMWDLIVNAIGALVISVAGWRYLSRARSSYLDNWVRRFIARNPQLFGD
ncbi:hypothetical protein PYV00_14280 [Novosphingobium sp. H3SJ31-1]|uniref:DUF2238 domain-containing protein n=2 Tax=Novosphingobium album (ex Liu et al. 2023) TaxID=3031130 RepID=A0ABT5WSY9_9SPHN|nr:hypothetical protein [Novosphingobium album (ex Liu et al. 2023)]